MFLTMKTMILPRSLFWIVRPVVAASPLQAPMSYTAHHSLSHRSLSLRGIDIWINCSLFEMTLVGWSHRDWCQQPLRWRRLGHPPDLWSLEPASQSKWAILPFKWMVNLRPLILPQHLHPRPPSVDSLVIFFLPMASDHPNSLRVFLFTRTKSPTVVDYGVEAYLCQFDDLKKFVKLFASINHVWFVCAESCTNPKVPTEYLKSCIHLSSHMGTSNWSKLELLSVWIRHTYSAFEMRPRVTPTLTENEDSRSFPRNNYNSRDRVECFEDLLTFANEWLRTQYVRLGAISKTAPATTDEVAITNQSPNNCYESIPA